MFQNFLASYVTILYLTGAYYKSGWNGTRNGLNSSKEVNYRNGEIIKNLFAFLGLD